MKRRLSVLLLFWEEGGRRKRKPHPCLAPLLGLTPLRITLFLALSLEAERRILAAEEVGPDEEIFKNLGWEIIHFKENPDFPSQASLFDLFFKTFRQGEKGDLLVLNPFFPLVQKQTLWSLLREHQRQAAALSFLFAEPGSGPKRSKKIKTMDQFLSHCPALILRPEASCWNEASLLFGQGGPRDWSTLPDWLKQKGEKILEVPLDKPEGWNVSIDGERVKIIGYLRERKIEELMSRGVVFQDPESVWIDLNVWVGAGTVIAPAVVIEGQSRIGREVTLYPFVHIIDSRIGRRAKILSSTMIEGSSLGDEVSVGPFAHLRPGTVIKAGAHVGNFVEMKKTVFGRRSKAGHLSYLGDSQVGDEVNIGAGTITCNYDGRKKHRTIIESGAFIGSGTELVAPVKIGQGAYVGAGSTITKDVSADALAVARARQVEIPGWAKRRRSK